MKVSQDKQKSYADLKRTPQELYVGEHVYVKVKPRKKSLRFGKYSKLAPKYCGAFEILAKVAPMAYQLALPPTIKVNNVFNVLILKKYTHDATHVIDSNVIHMGREGYFQVESECILNRRELLLWNRTIKQVKVQWKHLSPKESS